MHSENYYQIQYIVFQIDDKYLHDGFLLYVINTTDYETFEHAVFHKNSPELMNTVALLWTYATSYAKWRRPIIR